MKQYILAAVVLAACGGDEPAQRGTINPSGARSSVENVSDVFAALDTSNGSDAASAVIALTAVGQTVVIPGAARELPAAAYLPMEWPKSKTSSSFTGSAECNATGCVFVNFGDDSPYGSYRINGSIQRSGDLLTFDLTYDITGQGLDFHWEMDGRVRVNATLIDGEISSHGDAHVESEGETYDLGWDFDIDYNTIGLDATGCPVSGSLSATVGVSASGASGAGNYRASGSVSFGPTCGQVRSN